jgi:ubiquinone/menaquinone biosynthesis C-methylase UbiE
MIPLSPLEELPLGLTRLEVERLFAPFVKVDDDAWQQRFARRNRKIWRQYLNRRLFGWGRHAQRLKTAVAREYGDEWLSIDHRSYSLDAAPGRRSLWQWGDRRYLASNRGGTRVRQLLLIRALELLRPKRVLEVGCGNGINLLLLAGRFPETEFTGIDLTREGIAAAHRVQHQNDLLPHYLQAFAPLPLEDQGAFKRVTFQTGDAAALPFEPNSFDLVVTSLALEQMERIRGQAFDEIARVCAAHALLIEPFREANESGISRRYIVARDYLRARIADLPSHGLTPLWATTDMPQEAFLKAAAVLAKVDR